MQLPEDGDQNQSQVGCKLPSLNIVKLRPGKVAWTAVVKYSHCVLQVRIAEGALESARPPFLSTQDLRRLFKKKFSIIYCIQFRGSNLTGFQVRFNLSVSQVEVNEKWTTCALDQ